MSNKLMSHLVLKKYFPMLLFSQDETEERIVEETKYIQSSAHMTGDAQSHAQLLISGMELLPGSY